MFSMLFIYNNSKKLKNISKIFGQSKKKQYLCALFRVLGSQVALLRGRMMWITPHANVDDLVSRPADVIIKKHFLTMYAIVEMQGLQYKVEAGKKLFVNRMNAEKGAEVTFEKVLLVDNNGEVKVGAPVVEGAKVVCEVLDNECRGEKVLVFHKKRRKGYRKLNGHRQDLTNLVVKEIVLA